MKKIKFFLRVCPQCGFKGDLYNFSPSIEIEEGDFRIFHLYSGMKGPLYCNQCKRKYLLKIAKVKKLNSNQILFLEREVDKNDYKMNK